MKYLKLSYDKVQCLAHLMLGVQLALCASLSPFQTAVLGMDRTEKVLVFFLAPPLSFLPFAWEGLAVKYMINQNRPQFYSPLYSLLEQRAYIFIYSRHFEFKMTNYKFFEWSAENQNGNAVDEEVFFTIHQSVLLTLQYMSISQTQLDQEKSFQIVNC